jgi:hypothetical protein
VGYFRCWRPSCRRPPRPAVPRSARGLPEDSDDAKAGFTGRSAAVSNSIALPAERGGAVLDHMRLRVPRYASLPGKSGVPSRAHQPWRSAGPEGRREARETIWPTGMRRRCVGCSAGSPVSIP